MTDRELMLRGILDNPADDTRRLVYADALEESGKPWNAAHAELIRHQIRRQGAPMDDVTRSRKREEAILKKWGMKWIPLMSRQAVFAQNFTVRGETIDFNGAEVYVRYTFERGFPSRITVHGENGFSPDLIAETVRGAAAHRPLEMVTMLRYGFLPQVSVIVWQESIDGCWRAVLRVDDLNGKIAELASPSRRELFAGLTPWLVREWSGIPFRPDPEYAEISF